MYAFTELTCLVEMRYGIVVRSAVIYLLFLRQAQDGLRRAQSSREQGRTILLKGQENERERKSC